MSSELLRIHTRSSFAPQLWMGATPLATFALFPCILWHFIFCVATLVHAGSPQVVARHGRERSLGALHCPTCRRALYPRAAMSQSPRSCRCLAQALAVRFGLLLMRRTHRAPCCDVRRMSEGRTRGSRRKGSRRRRRKRSLAPQVNRCRSCCSTPPAPLCGRGHVALCTERWRLAEPHASAAVARRHSCGAAEASRPRPWAHRPARLRAHQCVAALAAAAPP